MNLIFYVDFDCILLVERYMQKYFAVLVGGVLPFGAVFIEVFFIMSSIWLHHYYYMFGFLLLVFVILILTSAEITIVMTYFQLCAEDWRWINWEITGTDQL